MINSKLAVHSTRNLKHKMKDLEKNWEHFILNNQTPKEVRTEILNSWARCREYDVNPFQKKSAVLMDKHKLTELLSQSELYDVAKPIIDNLYHNIKDTGHLIVLSDYTGKIIYLRGDTKIENQAQNMNFIPGADWSEQAAGSNAIGTSITIGKPIQILSHEHFCSGVHPWVCSASPIKDPLTKQVLGVIDLTGTNNLIQPHSLSVVHSIANLIEQGLSVNAQNKLTLLYNKYEEMKSKRNTAYVLVFDTLLQVVRGNSKTLSAFQIKDWDQFWNLDELTNLKTLLLNNTSSLHEWEWEVHSLGLKIFVQSITLQSKIIGYIFYIENLYQFNFSDHNSHNVLNGVIGKSEKMKKAFSKVKVVANTNVPILITGESGTGKEVFANIIHKKSIRKNKPFVAINCGALPDDLITSELFGYEPGVFTGGNPKGKMGKFEEANGGTILLDEIGEMPINLQVHLLRVLQEKEVVRLGSSKSIPVDVRIIAATNKDIENLIESGKFRSDLYFRLNVVELNLPPLKERIEDINLLCDYFALELAKTHDKSVPVINSDVITFFHQYNWPGNIRELMNVMEYAILFCENDNITLDSLPKSILKKGQTYSNINDILLTPLEVGEKERISQLIHETNGNISEIARRCNIARTTLYRKIKKYSLEHLLN